MSANKLRSREWFGGQTYEAFTRRAWLRSEGLGASLFDGRPVVGICNSWSELNNCNAHLRDVAAAVKRGVWAAGGFPRSITPFHPRAGQRSSTGAWPLTVR